MNMATVSLDPRRVRRIATASHLLNRLEEVLVLLQ